MLSQEEFDFIRKNIKEDPRSLALKTHGKFKESMGFLLNQIKLKQKAKKKLPTWSANTKLLFPSTISYEQCSSETTANHKSDLISGNTLLDMSGGLGVDSIAFSNKFKEVTHLEYSSQVQKYCQHNFSVLAKNNITSICTDSIKFLNETTKTWDVIYVDPDRRPDKVRTNELKDCLPNVVEHLELLLDKGNQLLVKASPMCDIKLSVEQLKHVSHVFVVSHKNECKEVLFLLDKKSNEHTKITATEIETRHSHTYIFNAETTSKPTTEIKTYLYDPYVCYRKAHVADKLAVEFSLNPISHERTLLSSEHLEENFPGRIFCVEELLELDKKKIAKAGIKKANVISRGFHMKADEIAKKLKIKDGGDVYLISWLDANNKAFLAKCKRL